MPIVWAPNQLPVRPKPQITSSDDDADVVLREHLH